MALALLCLYDMFRPLLTLLLCSSLSSSGYALLIRLPSSSRKSRSPVTTGAAVRRWPQPPRGGRRHHCHYTLGHSEDSFPEVSSLVSSERRIVMDCVDPFVTSNTSGDDSPTFDPPSLPSSMTRLANVFIERRKELAWNKRVVVVGSNPGWIGLLASRLGAASVVTFDEDRHRSRLHAIENADRISNHARDDKGGGDHGSDDDGGTPRKYCRVETAAGGGGEERLTDGGDADVVVLLDADAADNIFVQDFLRRTGAILLVDEERMHLFGYYSRITEGADMQFW